MGAFKNEKNGTWYVQFRYTDWQGLRQQKLKRGFATKREAQEWERAFLTEKKADVTIRRCVIILRMYLWNYRGLKTAVKSMTNYLT